MELVQLRKRFAFTGEGGELFVVLIVNWLLTIVTLGLYYPWAKARKLQYNYEHTELDGHPFHFHGTGKEMFKGFIKAVLLIVLVFGPFYAGTLLQKPMLMFGGLILLLVGSMALFPLIIHGSYRYRSSRSSWRGIHFGYRGILKELYSICLRDGFITLVTCGLYSAWLQMNVRSYVISHLRYGSSRFTYKGDGGDYFLLNLKGYFLSIFTFGIYSFWWMKDRFNYYVDNLTWTMGEGADQRTMRFRSTATGGDMFALMVVNFLIVVFTLGIGLAWAEVRLMRFALSNIEMIGDADLDRVVQTEDEHKNALADDLGDLMDFDIFL
jgi:uncharacterized membrane protein YjgN (DUF898 family)